MVQKSHGPRARSRKKMTLRRVASPACHLRSFEIGERVAVKLQPNLKGKGCPYIQFHGLTGKILAKRGNAYIVAVRDKKALKKLILKSVHLKKVE